VACDFACVDTVGFRRYYLLFFIDIQTRRVFHAGITAHPTGAWTTQAARNLFLRHDKALARCKALVRDRGSQFTASFDEVFGTEGIRVLKTPVRTPVANAFAERWIGTLRRELLDRAVIWNRQQLERIVIDYIDHYNEHRPHRSLDQRSPSPNVPIPTRSPGSDPVVRRSSRCDGLIHEYRIAA
jgi:transposase InsO family protein